MTWEQWLNEEAWLDALGSDQDEFEQAQAQLGDAEWLAFIDDQPEPSELCVSGETSCIFGD